MKSKELFFVSIISLGFSITACTKASLSKADNLLNQLPILSNQSVSPQGCLNVQALQATMQNQAASFPAISVSTDFDLVTDAGRSKELFLTNSALDVREMQVSDIQILNLPEQSDCEKVTSRTASGETLTYRVTRADVRSISLRLEKNEASDLADYRRKGLNSKLHPLKYDIEILDGTHLRTRVTYKTFDPRCRSSQNIQATLQTDYFWAAGREFLPAEVQMAEDFYNRFLSTLPYGPSPMPIGLPMEPVENPQIPPQAGAENQPAPEFPSRPLPRPLPQPGDVPPPQSAPQPIVTEPPVESQPPSAESPPIPETPSPQNPGVIPDAHPMGFIAPAREVANGYVFIPISELVENSHKQMKEELNKCQ